MEKFFELRGGKNLRVGRKTLVMGIVNVTPDSFSDGGKFFSPENALAHAKKLVEDGADILDIGAESTRPEAVTISVDEELSRLEKILPALKNFPVPISIDTYKPEVAEFALSCGADIINDVHGLADKKMLTVAKKFSAPVIAMHNKKKSPNIIDDIKNFFLETLETCRKNNFDESKIIFDVGIGFGKTQEENLFILKNLREFKNFPLLLGVSRKSVIGYATGFEVDDRDEATGAICAFAISQGVDIVRVHNVEMISKICKMTDILVRKK